jgi:hypothetical protein
MAFSDIATIRGWLKDITAAKVADPEVTICIAMGDRWVKLALGKWPSLLLDLPATEDFTRAIAESATNSIVYQRAYSRDQESAENEDRKMWEAERDRLLNDFLQARILASSGPAAQTVQTNASMSNRYPIFGYGKWSERLISDTLPPSESGYYEVREGLP